MKTRRFLFEAGALALFIVSTHAPKTLQAQSLATRIKSSSATRVQFEFAGRSDVCGDGQAFLSTGGGSSFYGEVNVINGVSSQPCAAGPVRVLLDRADGVVTNIQTVAGPLHTVEGATDLGTVSGRDASDYLMSLATSTDGRASRQAILPAAIADGVDITPALVAIARDQNRPQDTRRTALSWLARDDGGDSRTRTAQATDLLLRISRDENETQSLRRSALNMLGRVGHGAGIPALIQLATDNSASWMSEESVRALSQSGDPRAREFLRKEVQRSDISDATLAAAVRGLGGNEATGKDVDLLRSSFGTMPSDHARTAVLEVIGQRGTTTDTEWLLGVARNSQMSADVRRRALDLAARSTSGRSQTIAMYDSMEDPSLKEALIRIYGQNNDRASVDKLISIAKNDTNYTLRRRAIASLSRTQDARAREALAEITTR